jgi:para-aminobenzoate synthetase component 1
MQISFDHGPNGRPVRFAQPIDIIEAHEISDVARAFDQLDAACQSGHYVVGYATYELGYALEEVLHPLMPKRRQLPLVRFGVYEDFKSWEVGQDKAEITDFQPLWGEAAYAKAFEKVHAYIEAGDIYQANLTFPISAKSNCSPDELYAALVQVQEVRFGSMVRQANYPDLVSRSPELFFRTDGQGKIITKPMKGTQPRSADRAEDKKLREFLAQDEKNRAENLMIVDLLRNDLSRICEIGSVKVPHLFEVESFATVHQMTSTVEGVLNENVRLPDIMRALFPCGSITGAPKIRAMEIIAELESQPREIYCGTIGWYAPDGRSEFNVAIRTLMKDGADIALNVGGGVVYDSTAAAEFEEALWKARYVKMLQAT